MKLQIKVPLVVRGKIPLILGTLTISKDKYLRVLELKDDNTFTINGEEGTYLNKYFTVSRDGHPALLTLQ